MERQRRASPGDKRVDARSQPARGGILFAAHLVSSVPVISLSPGQRVRHSALGEGVIVAPPEQGYVRVFFPAGERQVSEDSLRPALGRSRVIAENAAPGERRARRAWLTWQAHALP